MTSRWPRLSIRIDPVTRATISAIAAETGQSLWEVLGSAVASHLETLQPKARKAIAARVAEAARVQGEGD
jgi:predicted transcriptional regulator